MAKASLFHQECDYNWAREVEELEQTKAGVKGLVDSGVVNIPRLFVHPPEDRVNGGSFPQVELPVIDFGCDGSRETLDVVEEIRHASEAWGFFQIVNHGIPATIMHNLLEGIRRFHEQPAKEKTQFYTRDYKKRVRYYCNGNLLVSRAATWRDSLICEYHDSDLNSQDLPSVCREAISQYMKKVLGLRDKLGEVLSMALGLKKNYLARIECMETANLVCHYYPACPEPELTLGTTKHSDPSFVTILLQDDIGGLQVFHQNQWINMPPKSGALVVNLGDLMQITTNAKFRSVEHRVRLGRNCPRVSAACFFYPSTKKKNEIYQPIEELISQKNPPLYRGVSATEYLAFHRIKGQDGQSALPYFELC